MISRSPKVAGSIRASLLLAALACGVSASATQVSYQYYRFTPVKLRTDATANSIALAEFQFLLSSNVVSTTGATVTNPNGFTPPAEVPANLIDGSTATKWLDFNKTSFIVAFPAATAIDGYRFTTGADAAERDPIRWTLEGSADGTAWTLIDNRTSDFATPTARTTSTTDILLPATVEPAVKNWAGTQSASWDTTSANWTTGSAALWDNNRFDLARFPAGVPTTINVGEPITVRSLDFIGTGYLIQGNTLNLTGVTRFTGSGSGEVSSVIAGGVGAVKSGTGSVVLSGNNTYTGATLVRGGQLTLTGSSAYAGVTQVVNGATLVFGGASTKPTAGTVTVGDAAGKGTMVIADTSNVVFNGTAIMGNTAAGAGVIRQTGGTATYGADTTYLTLGPPASSYGSYELSGGSLTTIANSGVRVGQSGFGVFTQSGGTMSCGRWFALGGANGHGVATFTGGTASVSAAYRTIAGDQGGGDGVLNIGTQAGGNAVFSALRTAGGAADGSIVVSGNATSTGTVNLNSGVLNVSGHLYQAGGTGRVNFNGGTLRAGTTGVELMDGSIMYPRVFRGGAIIDTDGKDATISSPLSEGADKGVYIAGGTLPVAAGGSGYIGAPYVMTSTSGSGDGAGAVATIANGAITGVTLTSPGEGYAVGDQITFTFMGGGPDVAAEPLVHKLTAAEVLANNTGGFTKTGAGKLTSTMNLSLPGPTTIAAGTFVSNGTIDRSPITVASGATLSGNLTTNAAVTVNGTFAPGLAVGTAAGTSTLNLAGGSTYAMQIADWTGAAGTGYDTANFNGLTISAATANKFTVNVDGTGIANFTEAAKQFVLVTSVNAITGFTANNWQVSTSNFPGQGSWAVSVSGKTLVLSYTPASATGYGLWAAGYPGLTDSSKAGDPDGDGIPNVMEYVLNGNPGVSSTAILPKGVISGSNYVFSYVRRAESKTDAPQNFEYSSTLTTWTAVSIPSVTSGSVSISPNQPSSGLETVTVTLPASTAVNGRLFGRLSVTTP